MDHHDAEITDVMVVLDCPTPELMKACLARLKELDMQAMEVNQDEGVIEGNIASDRVSELKKVPGVCYVRSVFSYTADFPSGDPRDLDQPEEAMDDGD